jgi:putative cell wall-binding protein
MTSSNLVTNKEVGRACKRLGIKNWGNTRTFTVSADEARAILKEVGGEAEEVGLEDFRRGLQVELEHGTRFPDANVTNNHPVLTGKIVLAHLKESLLYYKRLAVAELEGELLKATQARSPGKIRSVYKRIVSARLELDQAEVRFLAGK